MAGGEDLRGKYVDELSEGMSAIFTKTVTEADIVLFAGISGDTNTVHLDEEFAKSFGAEVTRSSSHLLDRSSEASASRSFAPDVPKAGSLEPSICSA